MILERSEKPRTDHVLFAPEGFVESDVMRSIQDRPVNVIHVRYLADGPFFQMRPQASQDSVLSGSGDRL